MRRMIGMAVAVMLLIGTTGCTPEISGIIGIGVDGEGNPLVGLAWCDRRPEVVSIHHERPQETDTTPQASASQIAELELVRIARYIAPRLPGHMAAFRLDDPGYGWRAESEPPVLDPDLTYYVTGGSSDFRLWHVKFRLGDLDELKRRPGAVLVLDAEERPEFITLSEFERRGNKEFCK